MKDVLLSALMLMVLSTTGSASDRLELDGYYKSFFVAYALPSVKAGGHTIDLAPLGSASNRLRLNAHLRLNSNISFTAAYDFAPRVQDRLLFEQQLTLRAIDPFGYRIADLRPRLYPSPSGEVESFAIFQNLDRAFFEFRTDRVDFFVGRQPIAWGSARSVNPTDIFAPYAYATLDTEDRIGVDAIRARMPLGFMGELDAGYLFGEDGESGNNALFVRTKLFVAETDIALMAIDFRENLMLGLDLTRAIGGAGTWLEAAYTFADTFADEPSPGGEDYFQATIGCDYSLSGTDYLFVEYYFNEAGSDDPDQYLSELTRTAYTEGATYLLGRHYLIPGVSLQVTPLVTAGLETLWNLSDGSAYVAPNVEYNVAENVYLAGGAFIGLGSGPEWPGGVRSEFGSYPDTYYASFRVYY